ncbi:response regulator [Rhizobium sp. L1K21]|uniref:response regulator n=1 Tax=Rhizobium sp. L1K21 TaxID=2954933 RepID=UPI002092793E|nr:response regulator [Rhizobium sp. L1K21]MCO6185919.1 response regulator [Rhizobium sp. L1K21]
MSDKGVYRIMVVEDDPLDFGFFTTAFKEIPAQTELFNWPTVEGAVEEILQTACEIAVVDINLRDGSGIDVIREIRAHPRLGKMPLVALSSSVSDIDVSECYEAGVNAYVEKPLSMEKYRMFAKAFGTFWLESAVLPD